MIRMALPDSESASQTKSIEIRITALHKLYHDDGKSFFSAKSESLFHSEYEDTLPDEIHISFSDVSNHTAYSAVIKKSMLKEIKETSLKKAGSEFERWIRQIFQESSPNFSFTIVDNKESKTLVWKKIEGKFKIRLAEIPLTSLSFVNVHNDLFNTALEQIHKSKREAKDSADRELVLKNDVKEYNKQMLRFKEDKSNLEKKLFEAFIPILNSKKDEIRRLKRKVGEMPGYKDDTSDDDAHFDQNSQKDEIRSSKKAKNESNNRRKIHTMSDSDSNEDSSDSNQESKTESGNNSQDILNMSPTLL